MADAGPRVVRVPSLGSPRRLAVEMVVDTRRALGLTHEEMAERYALLLETPVTPASVREWESGRVVPPGDVVMATMLLATQRQDLRLQEFVES